MSIKHSDAFGSSNTKIGAYDASLFKEIPSEKEEQFMEDIPVVKQKVNFNAFMEKRKKEEEEFLEKTAKKTEQKDFINDFTNIDSDNLFTGIKQTGNTTPKGDGIAKLNVDINSIDVNDCQNVYTEDDIFITFEVSGYNLTIELIGFTEDNLAVFHLTGMKIADNENVVYDPDNNCYYLLVPVNEFSINTPVEFILNSEKAIYNFRELNSLINKIKILDVYAVNVTNII